MRLSARRLPSWCMIWSCVPKARLLLPEANPVLEWLGSRKRISGAKARRKNEFFSPLPTRGKSIGSLRPPFLTSRTPMRSIGHDREATAGERLSAMLSEAVRASALKICPSGLSLAKTPPHPSFSPARGEGGRERRGTNWLVGPARLHTMKKDRLIIPCRGDLP